MSNYGKSKLQNLWMLIKKILRLTPRLSVYLGREVKPGADWTNQLDFQINFLFQPESLQQQQVQVHPHQEGK